MPHGVNRTVQQLQLTATHDRAAPAAGVRGLGCRHRPSREWVRGLGCRPGAKVRTPRRHGMSAAEGSTGIELDLAMARSTACVQGRGQANSAPVGRGKAKAKQGRGRGRGRARGATAAAAPAERSASSSSSSAVALPAAAAVAPAAVTSADIAQQPPQVSAGVASGSYIMFHYVPCLLYRCCAIK